MTESNVTESLAQQQQAYADLIVQTGIHLQPGQAVRIGAEIAHREFVRILVAAAYKAGARYVDVIWGDGPIVKSRFEHSKDEYLTFVPAYEVARHQEMVDDGWPRISLVGPEYPDIFEDVDPGTMRTAAAARSKKLKFYMDAMMANQVQWCVAAVPTVAWAAKVFPDLAAEEGYDRLWEIVLRTCRVDKADPVEAWREHDQALRSVVQFLHQHMVRSLRLLDRQAGPDGKPRTDLTVGLTERPHWEGAAATSQDGVVFFPNMPTEEVFSTPHNQRTEGWMRTSKPAFPFARKVDEMYVRFEGGKVVEYQAEGDGSREVLGQFFQIEGTDRLGEVALVDVRSPVNQANLVFHETLFDENAACHIAFGQAYPNGVEGGSTMSEAELTAMGVNKSDAHLDVMIGTATLDVIGVQVDGTEVTIMEQGQFTDQVLAGGDRD